MLTLPAFRYGLVLIGVMAAMGLRLVLEAWVGPGLPPYITFYPAVMSVAILAGFGPGALATALSAFIADYWIIRPTGQLSIGSSVDQAGMAIFIAMGLFISVMAELYRRNRSKAVAYDRDIELRLGQEALRQSEARYRALVEQAADGIFLADPQGHYINVNREGCNMLGYSREEVLNLTLADVLDPAEIPRLDTELARLAKGGLVVSEWLFLRKDGSTFPGEVRGSQLPNGNFQGILIDITKRKEAEAELRIAATAFETHEGMIITDANGTILRINHAFTEITGYTAEEVIGKNPRLLSSGMHDRAFYAAMWECINKTGVWEGEIWNKRKTGAAYPEFLTITAVKNSAGKVTHYVSTLTDITLSKKAEDEIKHLAFYDPLTRLPNRRLLMDRLQKSLYSSSRSGRVGALLFIDLDDFKALNDTLGHDMGDLLLQQVAQRLESCVREGDTVARLGGDEFMVMLEDLSYQTFDAASQTEAIGGKILATLNQSYQLAEHTYRNSSSIGITLFKDNQQSVGELMKQADIAMYQSKKAGRNVLRFFDMEMQETVNARAALEGELHHALEKNQFQLHYQIQVDSNRRPLGAEALIRWVHPLRGMVPPAEFIPLAEDTGLILPIGKWVLNTACAQLRAWQQNDLTRNLTLSVNVSAKQFHEAAFVEEIKTAVQYHSINPMQLKLEPTESVLLGNIDETVATMKQLKDIGVQFSLDDFGTGYSSLQYLKKLPLNQLKIDQSFVRDLVSDNNDQAIMRTIIAMAQSLNLEVIAEGVETEEQQQILQHSGCNHFQGYLFGKPVPIGDFEKQLQQGN
jgi:diguanylate cyclase (GGDEF)-like protein/PAS domain S-box-containing protein